MCRVAGDEYAAAAIVLGDKQMQLPGTDVQQFEFKRKSNPIADRLGEIGVLGQIDVEGEFLAIALRDKYGPLHVGDVIVPPLAHRDQVVEFIRAEAYLAHAANVAMPFELDPERLAHNTRATVASGQIARANPF